MATINKTFKVNLRQNQNQFSKAYSKIYAEPDANEPINLKGFAKHLSEHGKLASYDLLVLVLNNVVTCMTELLAQGQPVKLDGLGTFRPSIENDGTKVKGSVEETLEMGLNTLIKGVHINFTPEGAGDEKITSRAFKDRCVFEAAYVVASKKKTIDGKERTYQEKIPISSYAVATAPVTPPEPDGGGEL